VLHTLDYHENALDRALYFPFINIPEDPSLTRVLLYWDQLGTIVPRRAEDDTFGPRTQELVATGLVKPVHPDEHFMEIEQSNDIFMKLIDELEAHCYPLHTWALDDNGELYGPWNTARTDLIHEDKATFEVWHELVARGMAERIPYRSGFMTGWLKVNPLVGAIYMAHLAGCLARLPELDMEPITDQRHYFRTDPRYVDAPVDTALLFDRLRGAVLEDVLPAPLEPVSPGAIASFKEEHWDLLGRFRRNIEARLLDCARETDAEFRRRMIRDLRDSTTEEVDEIRARLRERHWTPGIGVLCAAIAGAPAVAETVFTGNPFPLSSALTAPLAEVLRRVLIGGEGNKGEAEPLAFAALAQEQFA